jgi:leader peptidase (prepilin peptidase)/N-methyltransferase
MTGDAAGYEGPLARWMWTFGAPALGLIVGSFANVCIHRLPKGESVVTPRSRCPRCGAFLRAWENVPVLSYLALLGRCRSCRAPISPRYFLVEIANALLYLALALWFPPSARAVLLMAFVTALLVLSVIDLEHHLLPDVITLPGIVAGVLGSFLPQPPEGPMPLAAAAAALGGYLAFFGVATAYERTRGVEGLGQGDWKMAAMLGAFLGPAKLLLTIFLASLAGTAVGLVLMAFRGRGAQHALPLGTFLGLAGLVVLFLGGPMLAWYRGLLHG